VVNRLAHFENALIVDAKESRFMAMGDFQGRIIAAVVLRPLGSEVLSVISMRRANAEERKLW